MVVGQTGSGGRAGGGNGQQAGEGQSVMGRVAEVDKKVAIWTLRRREELNVTAVSICC